MKEGKVVVYFHVTFETHQFFVNRKPDISMFCQLAVYCLSWMWIFYSMFDMRNKKMSNFFSAREKN